MYINVLAPKNLPSQPAGMTNTEISSLVSATSGKDIAFEVSGLLNYNGGTNSFCQNNGQNLGEYTWSNFDYGERLYRWSNAGGAVNYLTSDHAISHNYFDTHYGNTPTDPYQCNTMSYHALNSEFLDYVAAARQQYSGVKVGLIESLGYWKFTTNSNCGVTTSVTYHPTAGLSHNGSGPLEIELCDVLKDLYDQSVSRSIPIDHFDIDWGQDGVDYDGYGRMLATEQIVHHFGWKLGVIANAYSNLDEGTHTTEQLNIDARDRTQIFLANYWLTGANPDKIIFQQWQPNPTVMGVENDVYPSNGNANSSADYTSTLGLIYASIFHQASPVGLAVGEYIVFPGSTIIKVTSGSTYCQWATWNDYLTAHNGNGDVSGLTGYGARPSGMTNTGACVP
jgi:hypothetical protein